MNKKILTLIPVVLLAACSNPEETFVPYVDRAVRGIPTFHMDESSHTTYLMLSQFGEITAAGTHTKGDIPDLFYENTVAWVAEAGTPLPTKEEVSSSVEGATFRYWAYYDEEDATIYPTIYTTVPAQDGLALKAIFDGTEGGGGSGGDMPATGFGLMFADGKYIVAEHTEPFEDYDQYVINNASFSVGQAFTLYDFANKAGWIINIDPYSFGGDSPTSEAWKKYLSTSNNRWNVLTNFTANIYLKLKMGADQIYIGLVA